MIFKQCIFEHVYEETMISLRKE